MISFADGAPAQIRAKRHWLPISDEPIPRPRLIEKHNFVKIIREQMDSASQSI
jgi:hypothetical protein